MTYKRTVGELVAANNANNATLIQSPRSNSDDMTGSLYRQNLHLSVLS